VKRWIAALPLTDMSRSARRLYEMLGEVNGLDVDPGERYRLLEELREPIRQVSGGLEKRYLGDSFPLPASNYRIASLNRRFQHAMAIGYELVAQDLVDRPGGAYRRLFHSNMLCTALHRSLRYWGRMLLTCYQIYAPYPENTWREIHHLYQVAGRLGCAGRAIREPHYSLIGESTLEDAYKQVLLFALAGPYRLRPGESTSVYAALEVWAPRCRLAPIAEPQDGVRGVFGLQPDSDQQPYHLELDGGHPGRSTWVLDTTTLGGILRHQIHQLKFGHPASGEEASPPMPSMTADLLRRLMRSWGMMTERKFERHRKEAHVEVVIGLSAVHRVLRAPAGSDEPSGVASGDAGMLEVTLEGDSGAYWASAPSGPDDAVESHLCTVRDETPAGLRLQWHGDDQVRLAVGDLIAVRRADPPGGGGHWAVGSVRWMRHKRADLLQFGVELLAPRAQPVTIKPCSADRVCAKPVKGLELAPQEESGIAATLVTPGFLEHFQQPDVMVIRGDSEQLCSLSRLVESTGVFARFEYEAVAETQPHAAEDDLEGDTDFTKLWEHL
jgi:hypothetical protein